MKIKNGDSVQIISGKDRGVTGKVMSVDNETGKILVEGVNMVYKHVRPSQRNPQGGRLHKEMPIHSCKAMVVDPQTGQATRVGYKYLDDGSKERVARKTGNSLGEIAPPKAQYVKK